MGYSAGKSPLIGHLAGPIRRLEPLGAQRQEKCGPNHLTRKGLHATTPRGALAVSLQLRTAAQGVEVRARDQDASDAGRGGQHATELERHLHGARSLSTLLCGGRAHSRDRPAQRTWHSRAADVLVAVRTTNGCLINSERHKHRAVCDWSRPARASISCSTARVCPSLGQVSGPPRNTVAAADVAGGNSTFASISPA